MTNALLLIVIFLVAYDILSKKIDAEKPEEKQPKKEDAEKLTKEMEDVMSYKIDDAIDAYKRGDE